MLSLKAIFRPVIIARGIRKITRQIVAPIAFKRVRSDLSYIKDKPFSSDGAMAVKRVAYIRSDFWLKESSPNGAVAHTEGVVNSLVKQGYNVDVVSTYPMGFIKQCHSFQTCTPDGWTTGISELEEMEYNQQLFDFLKRMEEKPDIVYQRYGRNNYAGLMYARYLGVPFVLEYNGSEIWMSKNWMRPLRYESMTEGIESCVLTHADLVVGNAEAFREELLSRGVEKNRILIIPNGVDPDRFTPSISGMEIRKKLGIKNQEIVVSFVGSFGPWHGAEILAKTIPVVTSQNPNVKYLFVGDGGRLDAVKEIVSDCGVSDKVLFVGFVDRNIVSEFLGASDILVSPQVPNPDGTPFFGSPTKLFEYMSMGKAIIASDLDQIGSLLTSQENAILISPGSVSQLADAILALASDSVLRARLGSSARDAVVGNYSWDHHVQCILEKIMNLK
jgi:glycosyltransferase involved in cell wall biosynthesis